MDLDILAQTLKLDEDDQREVTAPSNEPDMTDTIMSSLNNERRETAQEYVDRINKARAKHKKILDGFIDADEKAMSAIEQRINEKRAALRQWEIKQKEDIERRKAEGTFDNHPKSQLGVEYVNIPKPVFNEDVPIDRGEADLRKHIEEKRQEQPNLDRVEVIYRLINLKLEEKQQL